MLALQAKYGAERVTLSDIRPVPHPQAEASEFILCDAQDKDALDHLIERTQPSTVYMLVAMLSAKGESAPMAAWGLNMNPLLHTLEAARRGMVKHIFWPSSMAVFGPNAPKDLTPQETNLCPTTVYGVSKVSGELWCQYYHDKFGVDVRSIRYPGLIGFRSEPGGGTTDYAVEAFQAALEDRTLQCYLAPDERLPMMTMEDAVRGTLELMEAPAHNIRVRTSYNLQGCSFTPDELARTIQQTVPGFHMHCIPDARQDIAASWPNSLDDTAAQKDWGWRPKHDVQGLVAHILEGISPPVGG